MFRGHMHIGFFLIDVLQHDTLAIRNKLKLLSLWEKLNDDPKVANIIIGIKTRQTLFYAKF